MPPAKLRSRLLSLCARRCWNSRPCSRSRTTFGETSTVLAGRHRYSTARHDVHVACRSNGGVHLSILQSQQHAQGRPSPILLFLPPGPLSPDAPPTPAHQDHQDHQDGLLHRLQQASNATVVTINYRLGPEHLYPTPVHDVLTAYDWVLEHLASQPQHCSPKSPHLARIGVCGELIGGSLATMLALTECRLANHRIVAAAVNNPVVDWIFPSDLREVDEQQEEHHEFEGVLDALEGLALRANARAGTRRKNRRNKDPVASLASWDRYAQSQALPSSAFVHARNTFFRNDDAYFDRFASPIHFFRTPGIGYVVPFKSEDDLLSEVPSERELEFAGSSMEFVLEKRRRSHRMYPPTGMGLRLPVISISVGKESVLRDQGGEFVHLMRRSINRDSEDENAADRRVGLRLRPGVNMWSGPFRTLDWNNEIGAIGAWFGRILA